MSDSHAGHAHHIPSNKVLVSTFGQLTALMILTIAAARIPFEGRQYFAGFAPMIDRYASWWWLTNAIALAIAVIKAVQVIRYFMGVQYASGLVKLYCIMGFVGFTWLYILFFDYVGRPWEPVRGWESVPSTAFPRDADSDAGVPYKTYPGNEGHASELSHE